MRVRMEMEMSLGMRTRVQLACHGGSVAMLLEASGRTPGKWMPRNQILLARNLALTEQAVIIRDCT